MRAKFCSELSFKMKFTHIKLVTCLKYLKTNTSISKFYFPSVRRKDRGRASGFVNLVPLSTKDQYNKGLWPGDTVE